MNKAEFLLALHKRLSALPGEEAEERLAFYSEMIDDRMEEGLSEAAAVAAVGSVDEIAAQIIAEIPITKIAKEKIKPKRRLKTGEILLLVLGSPVWFSLALAVAAVILSLYVALWSVVISLWAVFASLIGCGIGGIAGGIVLLCFGSVPTGIALIGAGVVCAGLSIFLFYGCKAATKGTLLLTKKLAAWSKRGFIRKEAA